MKLQQYTGPVHAKDSRITSFYRYNLLLSLNEVGGDPDRFGRSVAEFPTRTSAAGASGREILLRPLTIASLVKTCVPGSTCCRTCRTKWATRGAGSLDAVNRNYRTVVEAASLLRSERRYRFYHGRLIGDLARRPRRTDPARAARDHREPGLHDQGGERGQAAYELADAESGL